MRILLFSVFAIGFIGSAPVHAKPTIGEMFSILRVELKTMLDDQRADIYRNDVLEREAVFELMGAEHEVEEVDTRFVMISGCRQHSCEEKSAAIVDTEQKKLMAVGLMHFRCHLAILEKSALKALVDQKVREAAQRQCDREATLDVTVRRTTSDPADMGYEIDLLNRLRAWARPFGPQRETVRVRELK